MSFCLTDLRSLLFLRSALRFWLPDFRSSVHVWRAPQTVADHVSGFVPEALEPPPPRSRPPRRRARQSRGEAREGGRAACGDPSGARSGARPAEPRRRRAPRERARERREGLELADDDVLVPLHALEDAAREDQRLAADDRPVPLVDLRRDDQVDLAELVLEEHEDDALRGGRPLPGHGHSGHGHTRPVRCQAQVMARKDTFGEMRADAAPSGARRPRGSSGGSSASISSHSVGSASSGVSAVGSSGSASWRSTPPEPGTLCERGTRPSSQSSARRDEPSPSHAPEAIRLSSPSWPIAVRCASSTTLSNGAAAATVCASSAPSRRHVLEPDPNRAL